MNICAVCGATFPPPNPRYASLYKMCSEECRRRRNANQTLEYLRSLAPEERRRRNHAAYVASGGVHQRAYNTFVCSRCGAVRRDGRLRNSDRATFLCGNCKAADKLAARLALPCVRCGQPRRTLRVECIDCYGPLAEIGKAVGLSRERIRQLVVKEMARGYTRAEAIEAVKVARGVA